MLELKQIETFYPEHLRHFKRNILREYLDFDNRGLSRDDFRALTLSVARQLSLEGFSVESDVSFNPQILH